MADFDAIVIGAGSAGCAAALTIARAGKSVLVIERGNAAGSKNMTGGRVYTHSLKKLIPDFEQSAPLERKITHERISLMAQDANFTVDFTSPKLGEEGQDSYSILHAQFGPWFADQAERAGAEFIYGICVEDLIVRDGRVCGVVAGEDELEAEQVILAEGCNTLLGKKLGMVQDPQLVQMAVGCKEVIELPEQVIQDRFQCAPGEGAAWLFVGGPTQGHIGGGFLYTNKNSISLGLVATLSDLITSEVPVYKMLDDFKAHDAIAPVIEGGKTIEYSGHLIPEGGYKMIPQITGDGIMITGDAAMLCINLGYQVRGIDFAFASGAAAGEAAVEALEAGDFSKAFYDKAYMGRLQNSFVMKDLQQFQGFPHWMESTTRLFQQYPDMVKEIFLGMFTVDGNPVTPIKQTVMNPLKKVGLMNLFKDVRGAMKAL